MTTILFIIIFVWNSLISLYILKLLWDNGILCIIWITISIKKGIWFHIKWKNFERGYKLL